MFTDQIWNVSIDIDLQVKSTNEREILWQLVLIGLLWYPANNGAMGSGEDCLVFDFAASWRCLRRSISSIVVMDGAESSSPSSLSTLRHRWQLYIMEWEKFFAEFAHFNAVPTQSGKVIHDHHRDVLGLDCGNHFLKVGEFYGGIGDVVIHEKMVTVQPLALDVLDSLPVLLSRFGQQ